MSSNFVKQRVINAIHDLANKKYQTIAVLSHGGPFRVIFREIFGKYELDINDCGFAILEANDGQFKLLDTVGVVIK